MPALEFLGRYLRDRREYRRHGDIDPNVDGAKRLLRRLGRCLDRGRIRDIGRHDQGLAAVGAAFARSGFESLGVTGQQHHIAAPIGEFLRGGAANARSRSGDDDDS